MILSVDGGGQTGFAVFRSTSSGGTYTQIGTTGSTTTTYSDTGLTASTTYYYKVWATNSYGDSSYSSVANATTTSASANIYYIYSDQLNTPREITNAANTVIWSWDNTDPFGNNAANEDPESGGTNFIFNLQFPGQYYDQETGTSYNYFRDYDSSTGRYIESDPIGLRGGINTYTYGRNMPIQTFDALGLKDCKFKFIYGPIHDQALDPIEGEPTSYGINKIDNTALATCLLTPGPRGKIELPGGTDLGSCIFQSQDTSVSFGVFFWFEQAMAQTVQQVRTEEWCKDGCGKWQIEILLDTTQRLSPPFAKGKPSLKFEFYYHDSNSSTTGIP